ncbi:MAG: hypothetical protein ABIK77_03320 [candidate division WOR-3 bacterium]
MVRWRYEIKKDKYKNKISEVAFIAVAERKYQYVSFSFPSNLNFQVTEELAQIKKRIGFYCHNFKFGVFYNQRAKDVKLINIKNLKLSISVPLISFLSFSDFKKLVEEENVWTLKFVAEKKKGKIHFLLDDLKVNIMIGNLDKYQNLKASFVKRAEDNFLMILFGHNYFSLKDYKPLIKKFNYIRIGKLGKEIILRIPFEIPFMTEETNLLEFIRSAKKTKSFKILS